MRLIIRDDVEATSAYVARYVVDRIKAFNPTPQTPFVLGLPTGSSPLAVYRMLVEMHKAGEVCQPSQLSHIYTLLLLRSSTNDC